MNACQVILSNKEVIYALIGVAYAGLEYWLGKTNKVQAGSAVEAALNVIMKPKSPEDKGNDKAL